MTVRKFVCNRTGHCCRNFKVEGIEVPKEFPSFISTGPTIMYSYPRLNLFDWEKSRFDSRNIVPLTLFFDVKNKRTIILNYTTNSSPCPQLIGNNECSIYTDRPAQCRAFPCSTVGYLEKKGVYDINPGDCPSELSPEELAKDMGVGVEGKPKETTKGEFWKRMYSRYGDSFIYSLMFEAIFDETIKLLNELEKEGKILLARSDHSMKSLKKKIDKFPRIDASAFYLKHRKQDLRDLMSEESIRMGRESFSGPSSPFNVL